MKPTITSTVVAIIMFTAFAYYAGGQGWAIGVAILIAIGGFANLNDDKKSNTQTSSNKTTKKPSQSKANTPKKVTRSFNLSSIPSDTILTTAEAKKLIKDLLAETTNMDKEEIKDFIEDFSEEMKEYNEDIREDINNLKEEATETKQELKDAKEKLKSSKKSYTDFMKSKINYDEEKDGDKFYDQEDKETELMDELEDLEDDINSLNEDIEKNKKETAILRARISAHSANKLDFTLKYIKSWEKNAKEYN